MSAERDIAVQYIGEGVRNIPGVGVFQHGTIARLPPEKACALALDDDFVLMGRARPIERLVVDIGQLPSADASTLPPLPQAADEADDGWFGEDEPY